MIDKLIELRYYELPVQTEKPEVDVSVPFLLLLVGFAYILLVGGLSLFRREGLSMRFAIEAIIITLAVSGLTAVTGYNTSPVLFLVFLYLFTMRIRLLIDLANVFAKQGRYKQARQLYDFAERLWPDASGQLILKVNRATLFLQENKLDDAINLFTTVLEQADQGFLGVKYEAAAHYNLGVAYLRNNNDSRAAIEFNAVIDTWPMSVYARHAETALEKRRHHH